VSVKRSLFCFFSLGVFLVDRIERGMCRLVGKQPAARAVVLYYHSVLRAERANFARQMDEIVRRAVPFAADAHTRFVPGALHVAVTFDDGYQNVVENALPELSKRGIPSTIFVVTDSLGGLPQWRSYSDGGAMDQPIMSEEQLRKIPSDLVQIGSHTRTHSVLPSLSDADLRHELQTSREKLEELLGCKVTVFSFPYGAFNDQVTRYCRDAGYQRVFSILPHMAYSRPEEYVVGRVGAHPNDTLLEFRLKISGAYRWLPFAFALKRRLVPSS
jgi:peptidoglycan/xylan/chitin deacetylase (PgdA/CDA1 family)